MPEEQNKFNKQLYAIKRTTTIRGSLREGFK
jgi:hypothetical protein